MQEFRRSLEMQDFSPKSYGLTSIIIVEFIDVLNLTVWLLQSELQPLNGTKMQFITLGYQEAVRIWNQSIVKKKKKREF